jgi:hypothetical protein
LPVYSTSAVVVYHNNTNVVTDVVTRVITKLL